MSQFFRLLLLLTSLFLISCSFTPELKKYPDTINLQSKLPRPDIKLNIKGLGPCTDDADRSIHLNSHQPVSVLVHGCYGSAGRFLALSQVLAFHGQQSVCFSYNDRDSMMKSSRELAVAVEELSENLNNQKITVMGHSQGGLVARKALISERDDPIKSDLQLELVTISAPLSGIYVSNPCANPFIRIATLGVLDLVCWLISGDKYDEITTPSDFIQKPGKLSESVKRYLRVATDEKNTCRYYDDAGLCIEDDYVFSLEEQNIPTKPESESATRVEVKAGHVEIVGESGNTPKKLISVLQQQGYIKQTEPGRVAQFNVFLQELYGE